MENVPKNSADNRLSHFEEELYENVPMAGSNKFNGIKKGILGAALAGLVAVSVFSGCSKNITTTTPTPQIGRPVDSSQNTGQTITDIYYSQARSAILQDVPDLADAKYKSALDYTAQRMVVLNKSGLSTEQIRQPLKNWLQANINWDLKGERLIPFNEKDLDFIPETLFRPNATFDLATNKSETSAWTVDTFEKSTSLMIREHDNIWKQINDPTWVNNQLDLLEGWSSSSVAYEGIRETFPVYAKAVRTKGTDIDKKHWALYMKGRDDARFLESGEEIRKYAAQTRILAVGGKALIEIWGFKPSDLIRRSDGTRVIAGHGDLAVYESPELGAEFTSNPAIYGTPLNRRGYLGVLPNIEGVAIQGTGGTQPEIAAMWLEVPVTQLGQDGKMYFYGNAAVAKQYGHN